jgi:predicted PhzF superfamily epimerase YddE/YHI9
VGRLSPRGIVVTARAASPDAGYDFVSRFFAPAVGISEDPVTGSAHTALAPFWSARLGGRTELVGYQASRRGGRVAVSLRGDRTLLTGTAVTTIDGTLLV